MASFPIFITRMSGVPRGHEIGKGGYLWPIGQERAAYLRALNEGSRDAKEDLCRYINHNLMGKTREQLLDMPLKDVISIYRQQDGIRPEQ